MRAPVMPNGCPSAIAPPDTFSLVLVDAQLAGRTQHLHREGLVDLEQVDVADRQTGPLQRLLGSLDRAQPHDLRREAADPGGHDAGQRFEAQFLGLGGAGDHQRGGPIVEWAGVAAVTVPLGRNTGLSSLIFSYEVPGRGPSSVLTVVPSGRVTGVISRSKNPLLMASSARFWLRTPQWSLLLAADVSQDRHVFRRSGPSRCRRQAGSCQRAGRATPRRPRPRRVERSWAASNTGFLVSGQESELPLTKRDTVSTPAEMKASPSPALIAWKAIRVVCSDDEQYRLTVVPGRKS